jgi:hypothetical protein
MGWTKPLDFYRVLARHFELEFVNLIDQPADEQLFDTREYANYAQHLYLPWRRKGRRSLDRNRRTGICTPAQPLGGQFQSSVRGHL